MGFDKLASMDTIDSVYLKCMYVCTYVNVCLCSWDWGNGFCKIRVLSLHFLEHNDFLFNEKNILEKIWLLLLLLYYYCC